MVYLGRICGIGLTEDGKPAVGYRVEGRSPASRERKAIAYPDKGMIHIGPLDGSDNDPLRHYDAVLVDSYNFGKTVAVTNGRQTSDVMEFIAISDRSPGGLIRVLERWGYEPDEPINTPRIAASLSMIHGKNDFLLGSISRTAARALAVSPREGDLHCISTYAGSNSDPKEIIIPYAMPVFTLPLREKTAQGMADYLFDALDSKFVVCTAAALWDEDGWKLAVRNLHE